ncbi:5'/3'-nucleotidase SurE [Rubrivirga sp.]|uniref:5'/3'-nucleotidase SurE n=1 Tax=Rubrivirga sp. TaxID=1885344 RepID=UPI003C788EB7
MTRPDPLDAPTNRPLVLVSNDDGIDAAGIAALVAALDGLGTIAVVAPFEEQSAVGHGITIRDPIRVHAMPFEGASGPVWARAVTGTPADCVKIAVQKLLPRAPDLVVSGINHGPNTAVNVMYSGTVSAATEGTILGLPSIAMSHAAWVPPDFEVAGIVARRLATRVLEDGLPDNVLLNVNVPEGGHDEVHGLRATRQASARWEEQFEERHDPVGRPYYWLGGRFVDLDDRPDTDLAALRDGYVSVTPLHLDLTAHDHMARVATIADAVDLSASAHV